MTDLARSRKATLGFRKVFSKSFTFPNNQGDTGFFVT